VVRRPGRAQHAAPLHPGAATTQHLYEICIGRVLSSGGGGGAARPNANRGELPGAVNVRTLAEGRPAQRSWPRALPCGPRPGCSGSRRGGAAGGCGGPVGTERAGATVAGASGGVVGDRGGAGGAVGSGNVGVGDAAGASVLVVGRAATFGVLRVDGAAMLGVPVTGGPLALGALGAADSSATPKA